MEATISAASTANSRKPVDMEEYRMTRVSLDSYSAVTSEMKAATKAQEKPSRPRLITINVRIVSRTFFCRSSSRRPHDRRMRSLGFRNKVTGSDGRARDMTSVETPSNHVFIKTVGEPVIFREHN